MRELWSAGIAFIVALQETLPWLELLMQTVSAMGRTEFYLVVMPLIYWCWDERIGRKVGLILLVSAMLNQSLKWFFHGPRPYWLPGGVLALSAETTFGFPSGHSQHAMAVWGLLATQVRRGWRRWALVAIIVLIGFSRAFLGVHFPHDILVGWAIGAWLLAVWVTQSDKIGLWFEALDRRRRYDVALAGGLAALILGGLAQWSLASWVLPAGWVDQALRMSGEVIHPADPSDLFTSVGVLTGMLLGMAWIEPRGGLNAGGTVWQRVARYALGSAFVAALWLLGHLIPDSGLIWLDDAVRLVRYGLIGFWVTGGAPALFVTLHLAKRRQTAA